MRIEELDTPVLLIDRKIMQDNLARMANLCQVKGIKLRPHIKTHKIGEIALMQVKLSGNGIAVAKLGEAEVMSRLGIKDIVIANQIIGMQKIERLGALRQKCEVKISVDSREGVEQLERYLNIGEKRLGLFMEIDTGMNRCGLTDPEEILSLAESISASRKLFFAGIMSHSGNIYKAEDTNEVKKIALEEAETMADTAECLRGSGITVAEVSIGSTAAAEFLGLIGGITEFRPGNYVFNDALQVSLGAAGREDCALRVLTTVISRTVRDRAVIDAGSKSLGMDKGAHGSEIIKGHGIVVEYPDAVIERLSEEHGILRINETSDLSIGDKVTIIPNHACPVTNLFDEVTIIEKGRVVDQWRVIARGKAK